MARTNIVLDDALVEKAMAMTGARTKREVVEIALRRLVEKGTLHRRIRAARGKLRWQGNLEAWRRGRPLRRRPGGPAARRGLVGTRRVR
jgi:Arc/MetJ family transcription regulator